MLRKPPLKAWKKGGIFRKITAGVPGVPNRLGQICRLQHKNAQRGVFSSFWVYGSCTNACGRSQVYVVASK